MPDYVREPSSASPALKKHGSKKPAGPAQPRPAGPARETTEMIETKVDILDVCPNCGSTEREMEPFIDENGTLTNLLTVVCTGCGYRLGDVPSLPPADGAEDTEKSLAVLPPKDLQE